MDSLYRERTDAVRVVIVEDEPPMLRFLHRFLAAQEGFEVIGEALNAEEAVRMLEESEPELLISDIRMPGMSGLELAQKCRRASAGLHIIIVTGYKTFAYAKAAIDLNIDAFITKPVDPEEFREVLARIRDAHREKLLQETREQLEKAFQYNEEKAFGGLLSGREFFPCSVIFVYYAGEAEELSSCVSRIRGRLLQISWQSAAVFFVRQESAEEAFRYITVKFSGAPRKKKTAVCVLTDAFSRETLSIALLKDFYRKQLLQMVVPGSFGIYTEAALRGAVQKAAGYDGDEALCKKLELSAVSRDWEAVWRQLHAAFAVWKREQLPTAHLRKRIHSMLALCDKTGVLKTNRISLCDQLDESMVSLDDYGELEACVLETVRANIDAGDAGSEKEGELFEQIRTLVLQNLSHSYSLQEICGIFKVSQPYVRKIFTGRTGKTYNDYILDEKIRYAAEMMDSNPNIPVKELAAALGFEQLYFSTVFKKNTGLTPSQYKQAAEEKKRTGGEDED